MPYHKSTSDISSKESPIWDFILIKMKHRESPQSSNPFSFLSRFLGVIKSVSHLGIPFILVPVPIHHLSGTEFCPLPGLRATGSPHNSVPLLSAAGSQPGFTPSAPSIADIPKLLASWWSGTITEDIYPTHLPLLRACCLLRESSSSYDVSDSVTNKEEQADRVRGVARQDHQRARARRDRR